MDLKELQGRYLEEKFFDEYKEQGSEYHSAYSQQVTNTVKDRKFYEIQKELNQVKAMRKPSQQLKIDMVMLTFCMFVIFVRKIKDKYTDLGGNLDCWEEDEEPNKNKLIVNFVKLTISFFPNTTKANSFLILYICKPIIVYLFAKYGSNVHFSRVYYSKKVFIIRILYNTLIFLCTICSFDITTQIEEAKDGELKKDLVQLVCVLLPITLLELVIYFCCVSPNDARISKIKYRKIAKRIVTPKQNFEMWSTDDDVDAEITEENVVYK